MNESEHKAAISSMKNGFKASKDKYYETIFHPQASFSFTLDLLRNDGCPHYFYASPSAMVKDIYFGLLQNKPCKDLFPIQKDLFHSHICKHCAILICGSTNNLKSFHEHIIRYGKTYRALLQKRPISMCYELMNLWQITLFFLQTLNYPSIMKLFMSTQTLFGRVMILLHWFIDSWIYLGNISEKDMKPENTELKNINDIYLGLSIRDVVDCHERHLLENLYVLISHAVFYWKCPQIQWYLQMGKNACFILRYVIDELQRPSNETGVGYTGNMYLIFSTCFLKSLHRYTNKKKIHLPNYFDMDDIQLLRISAKFFRKGNEESVQRMNQCHFRNYLLVRCNNRKCNKKYWDHVYKTNWNELRLKRNNFSRLDCKLRVNKWYKCSDCHLVVYCSRKCQKYDWNRFWHKQYCLKLQQLQRSDKQ